MEYFMIQIAGGGTATTTTTTTAKTTTKATTKAPTGGNKVEINNI